MAYGIIKHRRGTTEEWLNSLLVPEEGELIIEECSNGTRKCKIGDGRHRFNGLVYIDADTRDFLLTKLNEVETSLADKLALLATDVGQQLDIAKQEINKLISDVAKTIATDFAENDQVTLNLAKQDAKSRIDKSTADLMREIDTLSKKVDNVSAATDMKLTERLADLKAEFNQNITDKTSEINGHVQNLKKDVKALDETIESTVKPSINQIDVKYSKKVSELAKQHSADIETVAQTISDTAAEYNSKLDESKRLLQELVRESYQKHQTELAAARSVIEQKLATSEESQTTRINAISSELKSVDLNLSESISQVRQQSETYSASALKQIEELFAKAEELESNNVSLLTKIFAIENTTTSLIKSLTDDINTLEQEHKKDHDSLLNSFTALEAQQLKDKAEILDAFSSHLTRIYTELEELVNNDVITITKVYAVENTLTAKINNLKEFVIANLSNFDDSDIADLEQILELKAELLDEISTSKASLLADISALSTSVDTRFNQTREIIDNLKLDLQNSSIENASTFDKIKADIIKNKEEAFEAISAISEQLEDIDTRLADITSEKIDTLEQSLLDSLGTLKSETELKFSETQQTTDQVNESLQDHIDEVSTKFSEIQSQAQADKAELLGAISENSEDLNTVITDVSERVESLLEQHDTDNQTLTTKIEDLKSTTNIKFSETQQTIDQVSESLSGHKAETATRLDELTSKSQTDKSELSTSIQEVATGLDQANERINQTNSDLSVQAQRINNIITLNPGSTTGDAELADIRSGYNGIIHGSAGDAVRAIGNDLEALKSSLPEYIPANAVDGLLYEGNLLYLTSDGVPVSDPVEIKGGSGGGGSVSVVKVTNNLPTNSFTIAKGNEAWIDFTYTSFENEVPTGDGAYIIAVNNKNIDTLSGSIQHGVAKRLDMAEYLKNGTNTIKITCSDQYGTSRSLVYNISIIELKIESSFDSTRIYDDLITFRYKVFGQVEKTAYVLIDGEEFSSKTLSASVSGSETTLTLPKQPHGCHKITAYLSATVNDDEIYSNTLEYEIICIESDEDAAILASIYKENKVTQGDLISIPFMLYDPVRVSSSVNLIIYSQIAGSKIEVDRTSLTVDRSLQYWKTRKYPVGNTIFEISYTYNLHGVETTINKEHTIEVEALEVDVSAEEDSLQLHLSAQGRTNNEANPAVWTFSPADDGVQVFDEVTTTFENFNWRSNGWVADDSGDTCLRLNGDARAIINFKPFKDDFKNYGKTIEFEFAVRDVNSRDAVVINCFDGDRGFKATPDTAFLKSGGTQVSCRYKDEERIRVAVAVEHADSTSRFVSIYLDGILSGVQRYANTDNFAQQNPLNIVLGSSLCGIDIYTIRVYNKALSTAQVLANYIADIAEPTTKLKLVTDNEILDENDKVSYDRVKALGQIPIITFTGPMPTYKGDKKKKTTRMKFEDPAHPEMNFDVLLDQIDVQGTSSQFYIRKNWKVKLPEKRAHMPGAIPAKVFCIKVDYAEATGTHNTGSANYIETLYDREEVTLPPQKDDTRVRTTIQGFPIIIFEKETEDSEPVFSSKGNFNYDKDAENAFGFTDDYKDYGVECWEFCNNTSDPVNFAGEIPADWLEDFEPRYAPKSANFDRIEELKEIEELAASGKGTMTEAQRNELATLMRNCIANFRAMHDWVLSTATYTLNNGKRIPITPVELEEPVTYGETTYTEDNEEYRLAKFKYEFENYFNMHYSSMYYVFTFFALMTDQRAKNLFLTRWKDDDGIHRWYPYFYD